MRSTVLGLSGLLCACGSNQEIDQGLRDSDADADPEASGTTSRASEPTNSQANSGPSATDEDSKTDTSDTTTKEDPEQLLATLLDNYCEAGSVSCYMMDELDNKLLVDQGELNLPINPQDSKLVAPDLQSYLFDSALQLVRGYRPESIETFTLPKDGIIGFDLWLKPNSTSTQTRWNAFALDGFLSLQTLEAGMVACKYNVGLSPTFPAIPKPEVIRAPVSFPKDEFVHLACSFDGNNVSLWINGVENRGPKHDRVILPENSRYLLNWSSALQVPFDGQMGPVRVWHDLSAMREQIRRLHQLLFIVD